MRIFILLSSFVFISLTIKAQVSGTVTSATTGDVIPGVRVVVRG
ncbi:MAG: TonB-denpendent receptor, partial [Chlorobi bacterium]|nr:TonB-denpendent receptor [Chlorobiota bacterium]